MRKLFILISVLLIAGSAISQSVTGVVLDEETNEPIAFANLYAIQLHSGVVTNISGNFEMKNLPKAPIQVRISSVGYESKTLILNPTDSSTKITITLHSSHIDLKEVVISSPTGKLAQENVMSIEQRKIETLEETAPITLAEAISKIPGVTQRTTGSGIGKPVIRGLSGSRIVTYSQGIRVENQQWGDEHGLGVGEVGISSVEVIKGPASLLYGADALGGVLFFVDEPYANQNSVTGFIQSKFLSNTLGTLNSAGLKLNKNGFKLNVFGNYSSNTDYQIPGGNRVYNTRFDQQNVKASLGYNKGNWISNVRYSYLSNQYGITESDSIYASTTDRKPIYPYQEIGNHALSWENTFYTGNSKFNLILGQTLNNRKEFEDTPKAALDLQLNTSSYNAKWYSDSEKKLQFVLGSQGMYQTNENFGEETLIPNSTTTDLSGFTMAIYALPKIRFQGGLRLDNRHISSQGDSLTLALDRNYTNFNFAFGTGIGSEKSNLKINISSGFRAPNTSELLSDGVHEGTQQHVIGNPDLLSENATQMDINYSISNSHFNFYVNPFANFITNYIYLNPTGTTINNIPVYEYLQTWAVLYGGEVHFHYHPHKVHWLHLSSDISTVFAEDQSGNALPLIPASRISSMVKFMDELGEKWVLKSVFVEHSFNFNQTRVGQFETTTPSYNLFNVGLTSEIKTKNRPIEINAGVKNIFNIKYTDHLSRLKPMNIPNQGINFYVGLKLSFEKEIK